MADEYPNGDKGRLIRSEVDIKNLTERFEDHARRSTVHHDRLYAQVDELGKTLDAKLGRIYMVLFAVLTGMIGGFALYALQQANP